MDLSFDTRLIDKYHSTSQASRVLTETWFENNMFCPRCGNLHIKHFENNRPVADFYCPHCNSEYELKSKRSKLDNKINDGAYNTMIRRITENNNPDLFCMRYEKVYNKVIDLLLIPKYFFTPTIIERRKPLSENARRAGWVGCNILIKEVPEQAKIHIIKNSTVNSIDDIVKQVQKCDTLFTKDISARGWLLDILNCVNALHTQEFSLNEIYGFEKELSLKHPDNNNIQAKIRQQLQLLRDKNFIMFLGNGKYKKL